MASGDSEKLNFHGVSITCQEKDLENNLKLLQKTIQDILSDNSSVYKFEDVYSATFMMINNSKGEKLHKRLQEELDMTSWLNL